MKIPNTFIVQPKTPPAASRLRLLKWKRSLQTDAELAAIKVGRYQDKLIRSEIEKTEAEIDAIRESL